MKFIVFGIFLFYGTFSVLAQSVTAKRRTPKEVVEQFWTLETHGLTLMPDAWYKASDFFIRPNSWPPKKVIHVIASGQSYNVDEAASTENWAEVYVGITELGQIDSALHFRAFPGHASNGALMISGPVKFDLVLSDKHWVLERDGALGKEVSGPTEWRIDCTEDTSWINVDAAISYVSEMRNKSDDPAIKKNAEKTLAILKKLKE